GRVRPEDLELDRHPARRAGAGRRPLLRSPLRQGLRLPQRCGVLLRCARVSRFPAGLTPRTTDSRPATSSTTMPRIERACEEDRPQLVRVWLESVRATHHFLGEDEIQALLPVV